MCWCSLAERLIAGLRALWRPRDLALALALGLVVTVVVIWRDADRADATYVIAAVPDQALEPIELTGVPRRTFTLPRVTEDGRGRVMLQIATYYERPTATVKLQILDARGGSIGRCTYPPAGYRDNTLLRCDVPNVARARRFVISHSGPARLAVFAHGNVAGYLAYTSSGDVVSRMRSVVDRVGVSLPPGVGPVVLIGGLWLSTAAAALGLLIALGVARERADPLLQHGEPLGQPAGVLAEPGDDEREVQHDGEEEAEGDDEERVGRRGDTDGARDAGEQGGPGGEDEQREAGRQPEH
jgi:hypothetical protein